MAQHSTGPSAAGKTVADWVHEAEQQMLAARLWFGHGTDNARDEAVWLVSHALSVDPATLGCHGQRPVAPAEASRLQSLLRRRIAQRVPTAYLTGQAWFAGLPFFVDPSTLIPRSPLGELILDGMPLWPLKDGDAVLDLCTGGGCIGIALAVHFPHIQVTGSDLCAGALAVAARNARVHDCEDRVRLVQGNLFAPLAGQRFALIVSNPPYVGQAEWEALPAEYAHEPASALVSGSDGLDLPLEILHRASGHLLPGGELILETGNSAEALQALLPDVPFTWLEFAHGGLGVLSISRELLDQYKAQIHACLRSRAGAAGRDSRQGDAAHVV